METSWELRCFFCACVWTVFKYDLVSAGCAWSSTCSQGTLTVRLLGDDCKDGCCYSAVKLRREPNGGKLIHKDVYLELMFVRVCCSHIFTQLCSCSSLLCSLIFCFWSWRWNMKLIKAASLSLYAPAAFTRWCISSHCRDKAGISSCNSAQICSHCDLRNHMSSWTSFIYFYFLCGLFIMLLFLCRWHSALPEEKDDNSLKNNHTSSPHPFLSSILS